MVELSLLSRFALRLLSTTLTDAATFQGGYNVESIANSALACVRVLLGDPAPRIPFTAASACATEAVHLVKLAQRPFWKALGGPLIEAEERKFDPFRYILNIDTVPCQNFVKLAQSSL